MNLRCSNRKKIAGFLCFTIIGLIVSGFLFGETKSTNYSDLRWDKAPGVFAISPIEREGYSGVLLVRLKDGLEQFIPGTWETSFSDQGNVYVFGSYPEDYPIEPKNKLYKIFQGDTIFDISLVNTDGVIRSVQENTLGTYVLIKIEKNQTTYFCIAEQVNQDSVECDELNLFGGGAAVWDPQKEHEVVVWNAAGEILTYDPWNPGLNQVKEGDEPEQYAYFVNLFNGEISNGLPKPKLYHGLLWMMGNVFEQPFLYNIPLWSTAQFIADQKHALVVSQKLIQIIELDTGKAIPVLKGSNFQEKQMGFRTFEGEGF